ncbi:Glyoxylase, beta-lactamase superfamily II [Thermosyntropha lipolytica DSM 11003]|uniref:Glyoxylase, beta-lactamase superfamily II n=1 Tax=Thermosyntropha lipolytica DSM 11003 TaxID=1123382 RepID=A0A1M5RDQ0_9FIRM|nr:MBL fold metallo-hydrolase [Thermosyntropha lipolytica]SHH24260.1 Glyoxylase, beta-lactamase superfamily II [Thermosyntropha lipolytica DSM 11003]
MVEKIRDNLYRMSIPLPLTPLKALNSYVIKGRERNLIIDTGFNREECLSAMQNGLKELAVDLARTDLFVTHMHADHSGLISHLATPSSRIYCSQKDGEMINASRRGENWQGVLQQVIKYGFRTDEDITDYLPGKRYRISNQVDFTYVREGDRIEIDDYCFVCLETPGHTKGHICLYEENYKILISGDHILPKITPNISKWFNSENPLADYIKSLDKLENLEVELVLPGHRDIFTDLKGRIRELKKHHERRCREVLDILAGYEMVDAFTLASQMEWDISLAWDDFPVPQKWFALGEALSHLKYLQAEGKVEEIEGEVVKYRKCQQ